MPLTRSIRPAFFALAVAAAAHPALAQDSLRILRVTPASPASPAEPVVVTFDHPVAPRLDESVDPAAAIRITPAVGRHAYWRDPSTLVVEFDSLWSAGTRYRFELDAGLRSATGLRIARSALAREIVVAPSILLAAASSLSGADADTIPFPVIVISAPVAIEAFAGRAWLARDASCGARDSIPLRAVSSRPMQRGDAYWIDRAGRRDEDRRADSLRRVVTLTTDRVLAPGCSGRLLLRGLVDATGMDTLRFRVRPAFALETIHCRDWEPVSTARCGAAPLILRFNQPVSLREIRQHVRVDGEPPLLPPETYDRGDWVVLPKARPRSRHEIRVSGALRSAKGERLGADRSIAVEIDPATPGVGLWPGVHVVPNESDALLRIRHVNVDSITVIVARVADSSLAGALSGSGYYYDGMDRRSEWRQIVADSAVLQLAVRSAPDSEGIFTLRTGDLPQPWRDLSMLAIRARGVRRPPPSGLAAKQAPGRPTTLPAISVVESIAESGRPRFAVLRRTGIAAHVWSADGDALVWVTGLRDARPRPGASVRLLDGNGRALAAATTDGNGVARLVYSVRPPATTPPGRAILLETRLGADRDVRLLAMRPAYAAGRDPEEREVEAEERDGDGVAEERSAAHGAAFTERGIYRPGETVFLKGVVRRFTASTGYAVAQGDSARWVVHHLGARWDRERVWSRDHRVGEFGTVVDTFTVPPTARLGEYTASLYVARHGRWETAARASFAVAEYRVPEFEVRATADTGRPLFAGDTARVAIAARYLFGVPMENVSVQWWAEVHERSPWELNVHGLEEFSVGRSWWLIPGSESERVQRVGPATVVMNGRGVVSVPVAALTRPGEVTIHASATDVNRQQVTTELRLPVQVADLYAGIRVMPRRWAWSVGAEVPLQVRVVGLDGRARPGVPVRLLALRHRWNEEHARIVDTVWRTTRVTTADTLRAGFTPAVDGLHELLVVATDPRGREAVSSAVVWVDARQTSPRTSAPELRADKPRYDVGDVARIRVESPTDALAWITLSHEGILSQRTMRLSRGANDIPVLIPAAAIPGATLHVLALALTPPADTAAVPYWQAETTIAVSRESRELHVTLEPDATHYRPGDRVTLLLRVRDASGRGRRAEAAVWAVDQGVASLTALVKPDLLAALLSLSWSPLAFSTSLASLMPWTPPDIAPQFTGDLFLRGMSLGSAVQPLRMDVPAPSATAAPAPRRYFATTPFYRGSVVTDATGQARLEFTLPDNLTTFRLFAAAITSGIDAGSTDTSIVSARTLAIRPALPRVIRDGDVIDAGAVVTQDRPGRSPVTLRIEGTGVRITGAASRVDTLDGRQPKEIRFLMQGATMDTTVLRFHGTTAADSDAVEARMPMSPAGHPRAHVTMGTMTGSATVTLSGSEPLDPLRSRFELQLGSSPVAILQRLAESLRLYPYLCTEQLASGGRALLARVRAERTIEPARTLSRLDRRQLETAVASIVARQREDGGFGYWIVTGWTTPWLTSYALDFLVRARDVGIDVPASAIARAASFLGRDTPGRYATSRPDSIRNPYDALASALTLRARARPDSTLEKHIVAARRSFGWVDRLGLAQLLAARGDSAEARRLLADAWRSAHTEGRRIVIDDSAAPRRWIFRSVMRPLATLLITTAALEPGDPRLGPLFESVLQVGRSEQRWGMNTLDQSLAADAVTAMLGRRNATTTTTVSVASGDRALATMTASDARADTLRLPITALGLRSDAPDTTRLELRASTPAPLYYAATLYEVPHARPVRADDEGISVDRWYEPYDSAQPIVSIKAGQLVRVRLRVTVPADREFVAVDDPLPAGLEAVDLSLRTSNALPPFEGAPRLRAAESAEGPVGQRWMYGSWDGGWWVPWEHREIRDDRVVFFARQLWKGSYLISYVTRATTAGTFVRPPAHAEEMYNPAVHGRSDGGVFTVTP